MIDPKHLRSLREIESRGTVIAAADALGYSPSAVSQHMASLEAAVGAPVLQRNGRGIELTHAGRVLVTHADPILAALEQAVAAVAADRDAVAGEVRIGAFSTAIQHIVAPALAKLARSEPLLTVSLSTLEPHDSLPALRSGSLEVAIAHEYDFLPPIDAGPFHKQLLVEEPLYLALPPGERADGGPADLSSLGHWRWVAGTPESTCGQAMRRACEAAGFEPDIRYLTDDFAVALRLVEAGIAAALLPPLGICPVANVALLPTRQPLVRRVVAVTRAGTPDHPAIAAVTAAVASVAADCAASPPRQRRRETAVGAPATARKQ